MQRTVFVNRFDPTEVYTEQFWYSHSSNFVKVWRIWQIFVIGIQCSTKVSILDENMFCNIQNNFDHTQSTHFVCWCASLQDDFMTRKKCLNHWPFGPNHWPFVWKLSESLALCVRTPQFASGFPSQPARNMALWYFLLMLPCRPNSWFSGDFRRHAVIWRHNNDFHAFHKIVLAVKPFLTLGLFGRRVIVVTCVCPSVRLSVCLFPSSLLIQ